MNRSEMGWELRLWLWGTFMLWGLFCFTFLAKRIHWQDAKLDAICAAVECEVEP